jgi:endo-1,4-beta-xylanase
LLVDVGAPGHESMTMTRRHFLVGTTAACAIAPTAISLYGKGAPGIPDVDTSKSLGRHAAAKGILFGAAINDSGLNNDKPYVDLIADQCTIGVPESALKWLALRPTPDRFDFGAGDLCQQFLSSHDIKYRGHTLVWEQALPPWFSTVVSARNAKAMMLDHISVVVRHYAGKMHSWDVVNEAIELKDGRSDGLKSTPWLQMIGPEYIELAFHAAHEADPKAMLVYNENWLELEDRPTERKRQAALTLLSNLKKNGVPIHGLGLQSHLFAETVVGGPNFAHFLDEVADLGLAILITELDIRDQHLMGSVESRDQAVAKKYYDYLSFMVQRKALQAVLTWGLSSRYTWLTKQSPRPDGSPVRPLPYDADLKPTPAWQAIAAAFDQAPAR